MQGKSLGRLGVLKQGCCRKIRKSDHIIPFKEVFLSFPLNAETLYDGVMMASAGCILFLIYQKEVIQKIEDKINNLFLTNFIDQDSNIWDLVLLHLWFHFPNFPVVQLRIAWHVHSEGRGRHRPHPPVVPGGCRRPYGSREQPMHCRYQGVEAWRKNGLSPDPKFPGWQRLKLIFLWSKQWCKKPVWMLEIWFLPFFWGGCYHRDKGDIGHEEVTNLGIRITMFKGKRKDHLRIASNFDMPRCSFRHDSCSVSVGHWPRRNREHLVIHGASFVGFAILSYFAWSARMCFQYLSSTPNVEQWHHRCRSLSLYRFQFHTHPGVRRRDVGCWTSLSQTLLRMMKQAQKNELSYPKTNHIILKKNAPSVFALHFWMWLSPTNRCQFPKTSLSSRLCRFCQYPGSSSCG